MGVLPHLEKILTQLRGNTSIIFAKGDLLEVKAALDSQVREAPARVGSIAPKIVKAKIEIINDFQIITEGDKVTPGQSALLDKLKIRPFEFKMTVKRVMMDGNLFEPQCLSISEDDVLAAFSRGVGQLTACSLGSGYVVPSSAKAEVAETKEKVASVKSKSSEGVGGFFGDE